MCTVVSTVVCTEVHTYKHRETSGQGIKLIVSQSCTAWITWSPNVAS